MALLFHLTQAVAHGFQAFWARYPRREAKKDATKAWGQVKPTPEIEEQIHAALDWQIPHWESMDWYTPPLPATYLRGERWTDEPPKPKTPTRNPTIARITPGQTQQQDAVSRIQFLVNRGMDREEAKQAVYRELGWVKE